MFPLPIVLTAIGFNDELCFPTCKINDERTYRSLSTEMRTDQHYVMAKPLPKHALGIRRLGAHPVRKLSLATVHRAGFNHIHCRLWTPTPDPSPQGGGVKSF